MSWNLAEISGPWPVPIYGASTTDDQGNTYTPVIGYLPGVVFVLPSDKVTADLQAYAGPVPAGVPVLAGVPCKALTFTSEAAAQAPLAAYWTPDPPPG
jgi:hypothetical protein